MTTNSDFADWREFDGGACELLIDVAAGRSDGGQFDVDLSAGAARFQPSDESSSGNGPAPAPVAGSGATVNECAWLAELIGPPQVPPVPVAWSQIEEFMGVPLPADYRSFIDEHGPGTFGEITITAPGGPAGFDLFQLLRRAIDAVRAGDRTRVMPICPEPGGLIAWGESADGWTFSWAPQFPDPDQWSVVAYSRDFLLPLQDTSFSQFLRKYAEGDPDIADLLGRNPARVGLLQFTPANPGE